MACKTCMWFVIKETETRHVIKSTKSLGRCRKHAPTMQGYPAVYTHDWCGDHKMDENKIEVPAELSVKEIIEKYPSEKTESRPLPHYSPIDDKVPEIEPELKVQPPYRAGGTGNPPMADMPATSERVGK